MESITNSRQQLLHAALARQPADGLKTTLRLWEQLAPELISIIGEGGFQPLYARSVRLAGKNHPWLLPCAVKPVADNRFADLAACLQTQDILDVQQASLDLFTIFLDLLVSLIGEKLTTHLLHSAWSHKITETSAKDLPK
ncbi:MAG: hypothetical protein H7273_07225 [Polaromonas sp.]|nr:hypothetical protein [Polaromonas sp.]